jgi:hypothetical protein
MEDERAADPCALRGGVHEDHRDMQEGRIEPARAVIEASGLDERHADDLWSKRHERQGI